MAGGSLGIYDTERFELPPLVPARLSQSETVCRQKTSQEAQRVLTGHSVGVLIKLCCAGGGVYAVRREAASRRQVQLFVSETVPEADFPVGLQPCR